jgi:hypothetical protein
MVCARIEEQTANERPMVARDRTASSPLVGERHEVSPDVLKRRIVSCTAEGAVPTLRAISRLAIPPPSISLHRARGVSQASPSASRSPFARPKGGTVSEPEEASSSRTTSSRNGGRHRAESAHPHRPFIRSDVGAQFAPCFVQIFSFIGVERTTA